MSRLRVAFAVLGVLFGVLSAARAEGSPKKKFFGQMEYWSTGGAFKGNEDAMNDALEFYRSLGIPTIESDYEVKPGMGFRFGLLAPDRGQSIQWGGSLGYVIGPKNSLFTFADDGLDFEYEELEERTKFIRLMCEAKTRVKFSGNAGIRLGAGLGLALGEIRQVYYYENSTFGFPIQGSESKTWTGITWELSPSLVFKAGNANVELGVAIAGFPKLSSEDAFNEFNWTPFGVRLGIEF